MGCTVGQFNSVTCTAETERNAAQQQLSQMQQEFAYKAWKADGERILTAQVAALQVG